VILIQLFGIILPKFSNRFKSLLFETKSYVKTKSILLIVFFEVLSGIVLKTNKKHSQKRYSIKNSTIFLYIITFFIALIHGYFDDYNEPKQHITYYGDIIKFFKANHISSIGSRFYINNIIYCSGFGCENENLGQGRSYWNDYINISHCYFSRHLTYSGNGGVIFVDGGAYSMNVNYSMFYNCVCSSQGGAIYFSSINSYLRMICANKCSCGASHMYHFAYLYASPVNYVDFLSVSNCSHSTSEYYSIRLLSGNQRVDNTNSSMNNAQYFPGIGVNSPFSFTSSLCTFSNNKVDNSVCIGISSISGEISISYANIVHNNSPAYYGVVYVEGSGSRKMMYCIFKNNQDFLFCVWDGSLEVYHSFIDHSLSSLSSATSVSTNNNSFTNRMTYQIQFFNSPHCHADMPLIDKTPKITLEDTPMRSLIETISSTNEETLKMTFERTYDQTIRETAKETIPRTFAECMVCSCHLANKREIKVIFSFLLYPLIVQMGFLI